MATGKIKDLFPTENDGSMDGAGRVTGDADGKDYVFMTPDDVAAGSTPLASGTKVNFTVNGELAVNVSKA